MQGRKTLLLALAALAFTLFTASGSYAECRPWKVTSVEMIGLTRDKAKQHARGAWERKAKRQAGINTAWHDWANAQDREYKCRKKLGTHRCRAIARPCTRSGGHGHDPSLVCDHKFTRGGTAKAVSIKRGKKKARGLWEKTARSNWGSARDHSYDCRKRGRHRWYCNGIARACR